MDSGLQLCVLILCRFQVLTGAVVAEPRGELVRRAEHERHRRRAATATITSTETGMPPTCQLRKLIVADAVCCTAKLAITTAKARVRIR